MKYERPKINIINTMNKSEKRICNADAFSCFISKDIRSAEKKTIQNKLKVNNIK
jgi:hypothetical protein